MRKPKKNLHREALALAKEFKMLGTTEYWNILPTDRRKWKKINSHLVYEIKIGKKKVMVQLDEFDRWGNWINEWSVVVRIGSQNKGHTLQEWTQKPKTFSQAVKSAEGILNKLNDEGQLGMPYIPTSDACFSLDVDVPDSMGHETHEAMARIKKLVGGNINAFVADRLMMDEVELCKALAAEQIDSVAATIYNFEAYRQGIIVADQTGIGKGRQAAAIIRYAVCEGLKPIFITEKPNLFSDIYRDLAAIGSPHLVPFIVNGKESKTDIKDEEGNIVYQALHQEAQNSIFKEQKLPAGFDFVCCTYSQLSGELKKPLKPNFIRAIADRNILILDESHNASGSSNTGEFLQKIVSSSKGVMFLSATFAKRPDNMPIYAMKTAISEASLSNEDLTLAITKGGVALQEVLASQLVKEGQMIRRQRTYEGIEVNYLVLDNLEKEHRATADTITEIIRDIIAFQATDLKAIIEELDDIAKGSAIEVEARAGTQGAGVDSPPYFSKVFNVINQMLFAVKAEAVADRAIMRLREGKAPVIAFASTMGSFLEDMGASEGETISVDFRLVLQKGLDGVMRYTEKDGNGKATYKSIPFSELSPEAKATYKAIQGKIDKVSTGICISPIDIIIGKLERAGYKVAEVTGRKLELLINPKTMMGVVSNRKKLNTNDAFRMFNNNEVDVLMINQSGSTGASAHAVPTKKVSKENVKQRVMIVLQAELDINREVQKRGRINRTGQILRPIYDYVSSAIPAEKRLMMMLQKKLKSLDANTSASQKESKDLLSVADFLNKYGDRIVMDYIKENPDVNALLGDPFKLLDTDGEEKKDSEAVPEDAAHRASGRVAVLSTVMQTKFYNEISDQYNDLVEFLKSSNEYDLEVEEMNLEAETVKVKVMKQGKGGRTSFGDDSILETCMCNVLKKPMSQAEVKKKVADFTKGVDPKTLQKEINNDYQVYEQKRCLKELEDSKKHFNEVEANLHKEKKIQAIDNKMEREAAIEERKQQIANARTANDKKIRENAENRYQNLIQFLGFFYAGRGLKYPTGDYNAGIKMASAVFCGVVIDHKRPNPYAPSSIKFEFAVSDSTRYISLKASGEQGKQLSSIISASLSQKPDEAFDNWESITKEGNVSRRIRFIVTGNILQAFGDGGGKLVNYTVKGGGVKKGILLPENYQAPEMERTEVPLLSCKNLIRGLTSGSMLKNEARKISIGKDYNGRWLLFVPASRQKAGEIYLDTDLLAIVEGNNFNKVSDTMKAVIAEAKLDAVLEVLTYKHNVTLTVNSNLVERIINKQTNDIRLELHNRPLPKSNKLSKMKLLELEAEALALELELLSFAPLGEVDVYGDYFKTIKFSKCKKGEYFRFPKGKKVYTYSGKDRKYGYHYVPHDDIWGGGQYTKTDRTIEIDFTY